MFPSPWQLETFWILEPWFGLKNGGNQVPDVRDGVSNGPNNCISIAHLGCGGTRMDRFLPFHGIGEHIIWQSPVTWTETVEAIETAGMRIEPPISVPRPRTEPRSAINAPSPPDDPPHESLLVCGLTVRLPSDLIGFPFTQ